MNAFGMSKVRGIMLGQLPLVCIQQDSDSHTIMSLFGDSKWRTHTNMGTSNVSLCEFTIAQAPLLCPYVNSH